MCVCKKHLHVRWSIVALIANAKEQQINLQFINYDTFLHIWPVTATRMKLRTLIWNARLRRTKCVNTYSRSGRTQRFWYQKGMMGWQRNKCSTSWWKKPLPIKGKFWRNFVQKDERHNEFHCRIYQQLFVKIHSPPQWAKALQSYNPYPSKPFCICQSIRWSFRES